MGSDDSAEILRLRERTHRLQKAVWALRVREEDLRRRIGDLEPQVAALVDDDRIAAAVAKAMRRKQRVTVGWGTRLGALTIGVLTAIDLVLRITHGL